MSLQTLSNTLLRDISNLYDKADNYDVKIQVGEDSNLEIFKAHSIILIARSNYFRTAFSNNWAKKEGDLYVYKKPNVSGIVFQIILKYIYTGTIALDASNVENNFIDLLIAADEMNLYELVEHLQQHIISSNHLNNDWIVQNGIKLFNTISLHKGAFPKLEEFCKNIMSQEPKLLIGSSKLLPKELEEDLNLYYVVPNCKLATKVFPPRKSQIVENSRAIADGEDKNQGFGNGDLFIFGKSCKLTSYSVKIHDSEYFKVDDYEVFQVVKK
ncbi:unnamed protein product [Rhizophagus irregularis]|nr:unnamed protein product [Rhizophagus irregularis]